jgi:pimeloyl-ACP methyl ester carboxylesterase
MLLPGKSPWMRRLLLMLMASGLRRDPGRFLVKMIDAVSEPDKLLLAQPEVRQTFIDSLGEAFRSGTRGASWDAALYKRPWGFRLEDISAEVHLWHGELDIQVPVSVGRYVADAMPNCRARFFPDEGHLSLARSQLQDILEVLVS